MRGLFFVVHYRSGVLFFHAKQSTHEQQLILDTPTYSTHFTSASMTTAHRPTWKAAVGRENTGGWSAGGAVSTQISALDAPAHTVLKFRKGNQVVDKKAALKESLMALEEAESKIPLIKRTVDPEEEERAKMKLLKQTADVDEEKIRQKYDDSDVDDGGGSSESESDLDAIDSDLENESDSDDDDEAALQAELAKIRAEREAAKIKAEEEVAAEEMVKEEESALLGNPLLAGANVDTNRTKRRWNDDVVFRNQAKGEPVQKKRFINDTVRNDFHKRFLNKFIR